MYTLLSFLSAFSWLPLLIAVIALIKSNNANARISSLEKKLNEKNVFSSSNSYRSEEVLEHTSSDQAVGLPNKEKEEKKEIVSQVKEVQESEFEAWLKRDWLLKLGGVLVLLGVLFLLSVTVAAMGPVGKIITGYIIGIALMVFGFYWAKKYVDGGTSINLIGAIVVIFTTYTARTPEYLLFDSFVALLLIFVTSTFVALLALVYKKQNVAHVALGMASFAPLLIASSSNDFAGLLLYLLVVTFGVIWLAIVSGWRTLILLSQIIVILYSLPYTVSWWSSHNFTFSTYLLLMVFGVTFFLSSIISIVKEKGKTIQVDGIIAACNALFATLWIFSSVPKGGQGIMLALVALMYILGVFLVFKITESSAAFLVYSMVSLVLVMLATFAQWSGVAQTLAFIFEAGLATLFVSMLAKDERSTHIIAFTNIIPVMYVFGALANITSLSTSLRYATYYGNLPPVDNVGDITISIVAIFVYFFMALFLRKGMSSLWKVFAWLTTAITVVFVWQITHHLMSNAVASFISLIIYTIAGISVLFYGSREGNAVLVKVGRVSLGVVALRVLFVDAWVLGAFAGVFVCIGVGILLLSTTLITKK